MNKKNNTRQSATNSKAKRNPLVAKIRKAVVFVTLGLIVLFFYEAYFG